MENDEGGTTKIRLEEVMNVWMQALLDMEDYSAHVVSFLQDWIKSGVGSLEGWKASVKKAIIELENYSADIVELPAWLA